MCEFPLTLFSVHMFNLLIFFFPVARETSSGECSTMELYSQPYTFTTESQEMHQSTLTMRILSSKNLKLYISLQIQWLADVQLRALTKVRQCLSNTCSK